MPVQAPQWTDFLSCLICYNEFECSVRRPISLGCGHTMCKNCLSKLQRKQCPFDQTVINADLNQLPENYALLQLVGGRVPDNPPSVIPLVSREDYNHYLEAKKSVEDLALYLKSPTNGILQNSALSRPMQRKLITIINCQLVEEEGRRRGMRSARSLGERCVTELILQHQNPQQLSANLWAAVRARGCQFLGPAMQEEVLKLVLLALEDGSALSRKVLVMFVVQHLAHDFPQASRTSIGHVVQLLYRASCYKVSKREGDSSLMQLKEEFRTYESLRREHDAQIVQIATEDGLRIAPEQWSSLLYGDTAHKSHMQSIIDKLQTPQSFLQSVQELVIALQRTGDPGNLSVLRPYLELLAGIDPNLDATPPTWEELKNALEAARIVVKGLVDFVQNFGNRKLQEDRLNVNAKYKTSMCRDLTQRRNCPRGLNCTFAHSQEELEKFRSKRNALGRPSGSCVKSPNPDSSHWGKKDEGTPAGNSSPTAKHVSSVPNSSAALTSLDSEMRGYAFEESPFMPESCSWELEVLSTEDPNDHFCNTQDTIDRCPLSGSASHSESHPLFHTISSHKLNPKSPAFQPLTAQPTEVLSIPSFPAVSTASAMSSENYVSSLLTTIGVVPAATVNFSGAKSKLSNKCFSQSSERHLSCVPTRDTPHSSLSCAQSVGHVSNAVQYKDLNPSALQKPVLKPPQLDCQTLTALQKRKEQLLTQLDKAAFSIAPNLSASENEIASPNVHPSYGAFKTVDENNAMSLYPPSNSACKFPYGTPMDCPSSDYRAAIKMNSIPNEAKASVTKVIENGLLGVDFRNSALFCPSEKDEFIPFDPPLVSKYGPISRCSKSLIRGPAPIQVNAFSRMGELTCSTSAVRRPLSSAFLAPSSYSTSSPSFAVPLPIMPGPYLPPVDSDSALPFALDYSTLLNESDLLRANTNPRDITKGFKPIDDCMDISMCDSQMSDFIDSKEFSTRVLKEELWEIEKAIQEKEQNILMDGAHYIDLPYRQETEFNLGVTAPVANESRASQVLLENIPFEQIQASAIDAQITFKE